MINIFKQLFRKLGFHVHNWSEWEDLGEIEFQKRIIGLTQVKHCNQCKKKTLNKIWYV